MDAPDLTPNLVTWCETTSPTGLPSLLTFRRKGRTVEVLVRARSCKPGETGDEAVMELPRDEFVALLWEYLQSE